MLRTTDERRLRECAYARSEPTGALSVVVLGIGFALEER
jgi:hypothetical protein